MATATAAADLVHVEVAGFQGFGEFHGSHIDCSADAELMARHPLDGSALDAATLNLWWGEYWNTGHHTSGGATLDHIYWHLTGSAHKLDPKKARVARYIPVDRVSLSTLHQALKDALVKGQTVIVYLGNAQALPYNERNVHGHFVALGGIDSDKGYLVGNGDDVLALGGKNIIATRWYGWNQLAAAQINGMIALEKVNAVATSNIPTGWKDDGTTLTASNGVAVVKGFRAWVLAHAWDAKNTPLAAEKIITSGSIEPGNASVGPGSRQDFRFGSLGWTQAWNVYEIATGQDLLALEAQIEALKQQIANTPPAPAPDPLASKSLALMTDLASLLQDVK